MFEIGSQLTLEELQSVAEGAMGAVLTATARGAVAAGRAYVENLVAAGETVYGVTTGFGRFATTTIDVEQVSDLQRNLLRSHAVGVGPSLPVTVVRAMLLLRAQSLALGASGVRPQLVAGLVAMLNAGVVPQVPAKGSVGASGDLAPLAHMALPLIGEGYATLATATAETSTSEVLPGAEALRRAGLEPLELQAKEGLALINGTQLMSAQLAAGVLLAERLLRAADVAAAMSVEGLMGSHQPFHPAVARLRPHPGAALVSANLRRLLAESQINLSHADCGRVQDSYSLRAVPQVHGASRDALAHARAVLEIELNSVTDNPLILPESEEVVSAGNFHGQPLAMAADYATIAMAEIANISERRIEQLVNPALSGLPGFLTEHGGLNSGLMVAQYTAAALVSENKVLAHPAVVDSIPTSANQEDHVSMGAHATRKLLEVLDNVAVVLAIEVMAAAQALDLRAPLAPAAAVAAAKSRVRELVAMLAADRYLADDIQALTDAVRDGSIVAAAAAVAGDVA